THYARAIEMNPAEVDAYIRQARLLRINLNQKDKADALMADLRRAAPDSAAARVALNRYFRESCRPTAGQADIERALQLDPDSAETRHKAALQEIALLRLQAAEEHIHIGLAKDPDYLPLVKLAGELERRSGKAVGQDIRDLVRRTLKQLEDNPRRTADVLDL